MAWVSPSPGSPVLSQPSAAAPARATRSPHGVFAAFVFRGFVVATAGFGTVAVHTLTENVAVTVRIASLFLMLMFYVPLREARPGPAWPDDRQRRLVVVSSAFVVALIVLNLVLASVGLLQLMLLVWLSGAMGIFMNAVREIGVASEPALRDNENDDRRFGSE